MLTLTIEGRVWAESAAATSIVARVALSSSADWPSAFVDTAIQACNAKGSE